MARVHYEEIRAAGALNRVHGMGFKWSLNPYQGCAHGCHYCFARRYHHYLDLDAGEDFSGAYLREAQRRRGAARPSFPPLLEVREGGHRDRHGPPTSPSRGSTA